MIAALEKITSGLVGVPTSLIYTSVITLIVVLIVTSIQVSKFSFWKKQNIKGPKPWRFFGNTLDLLFGPMLDRLDYQWKTYGPIHGLYRGTKPQLVVGDPEMLKDVLVRDWHVFADRRGDARDGNVITDNFLVTITDNHWKRMRSVMSPTFTSGKMKSMFNIINDCCQLMADNIKNRIKNSKNDGNDVLELNFRHLAGCYSMDVIAKCCFATETNSFDDPNQVFVSYARKFFNVSKFKRFLSLFLPNWIKKLTGFTSAPTESLQFLAHVARTIYEERTKNGQGTNSGNKISAKDGTKMDYLQLLIEASKGNIDNQDTIKTNESVADNESHHGYEDINNHVNESLAKEAQIDEMKKPLSVDEIISNSVLFLAVGYDTTSSLITMTTYNLACNQMVQNKLYQELNHVYNNNLNSFNYETISGLSYLDAVISETLRLLPPAPMIERRALEDYTFKSNGIKVPKGTIITLPIWNMHHDSRFWPEPEMFDPERFLPENRSKIVPYSYIPFGGGPRNCIGMRFALLEAKLAIAHLVINFNFVTTSNTDIPIDLSPTTGLLTPKSVILGVVKRSHVL